MPSSKKRRKVGWVQGFQPPTAQERVEALGPFPFEHSSAKDRAVVLPPRSFARPSMSAVGAAAFGDEADEALVQLQQAALFNDVAVPAKKKGRKTARAAPLFGALPSPYNALDWLATVNEEGQSFQNYVRAVTMRSQ